MNELDFKNQKYNERILKVDAIQKAYDNRETQADIAKKFEMKEEEVGKITRDLDYSHTRKKTIENIRPGETLKPLLFLGNADYDFLDNYDITRFENSDNL